MDGIVHEPDNNDTGHVMLSQQVIHAIGFVLMQNAIECRQMHQRQIEVAS